MGLHSIVVNDWKINAYDMMPENQIGNSRNEQLDMSSKDQFDIHCSDPYSVCNDELSSESSSTSIDDHQRISQTSLNLAKKGKSYLNLVNFFYPFDIEKK